MSLVKIYNMKKHTLLLIIIFSCFFAQPIFAAGFGPREAEIVRQQISDLQAQCGNPDLQNRVAVLEKENAEIKSKLSDLSNLETRIYNLESLVKSLQDNIMSGLKSILSALVIKNNK